MKHENGKAHASNECSTGLTNDFSEQEASMTASKMPPKFALTASAAAGNPGADGAAAAKPKLNVKGVPEKLVKMLEEFEGIRWVVYADQLGNLTGGMGHLIKDAEAAVFPAGAQISDAQVEEWAQQDVLDAWNRALDQSAELGVDDDEFHIAMASMCFQNGLYWNTIHKRTWALMQENKWEEAALEAANSQWARETPTRVPGFQAALRSQITGGRTRGRSEAAVVDHQVTLTKHGLSAEAKKEKIKAAQGRQAGKAPEGIEGMKTIQARLKALGLYDGKIDGIATSSKGESKTVTGIKRFQETKGLPMTGEVDGATWSKLDSAKSGDDHSVWDQFMANLKEKREADALNGKTGKVSSPFATGAGKGFVDQQYFVTQSPDATGSMRASKPGWTNCRQAATDIAIRYLQGEVPAMAAQLGIDGIEDLSRDDGFLCILSEDKSHKSEVLGEKNESHPEWLVAHAQMDVALGYIDEKLGQKVPVVIGVDHTFNRDLNAKNKPASKSGMGYNEGTTDHFITLTGAGIDEKGKKYYAYFDVATSHIEKGTSSENRLVETEPGKFNRSSGAGSSGNQAYYLSMVLIYKNDRPRYEKEIQKNLADKKAIGL